MSFAPLAESIFDIATEVAQAEARIKAELLRAARAGELARVEAILRRWASVPVAQVLEDPTGSPGFIADSARETPHTVDSSHDGPRSP